MKNKRLSRIGFSLIEVGLAMIIGSVLFGAAVILFSRLLTAQGQQRTNNEQLVQYAHLAQLFRDDVRAAVDASRRGEEDHTTLALDLRDGRRVSYTVQKQSLQRELRSGENLEHRETFRLGPNAVELQVVDRGGAQHAALSITRKEEDSARLLMEVTAIVGRDHRFE